jgi:hypothetical protein
MICSTRRGHSSARSAVDASKRRSGLGGRCASPSPGCYPSRRGRRPARRGVLYSSGHSPGTGSLSRASLVVRPKGGHSGGSRSLNRRPYFSRRLARCARAKSSPAPRRGHDERHGGLMMLAVTGRYFRRRADGNRHRYSIGRSPVPFFSEVSSCAAHRRSHSRSSSTFSGLKIFSAASNF